MDHKAFFKSMRRPLTPSLPASAVYARENDDNSGQPFTNSTYNECDNIASIIGFRLLFPLVFLPPIHSILVTPFHDSVGVSEKVANGAGSLVNIL